MNEEEKNPAFEELLVYLKNNRGFDFTGYKRSSLMRRVRRRMHVVEIDEFDAYQDYLEVHPDEFAYLFNTILINVTSFFRDKAAWEYLAEEIIPQIVEETPEDQMIRVWSAGCGSGEEAYTLAILFAEALGQKRATKQLKIYATDVDEEALAQARQAGYGPEKLEPVPDDLRDAYFELVGGRYVFNNDLRRCVVFGSHDLIQDAPISRLDLLVCRNTLIYLNAETQRRVLARFHFALNDDGVLFLGQAEMLLTHTHLFTPVNLSQRVFVKVPKVTPRDRMVALAQAGDDAAADELGRYVRLREAAFGATPQAQLVVDREQYLALANERAQTLFDLAPPDFGRPFRDLEVSYRPVDLRSAIDRAKMDRRIITLDDVEYTQPEKESRYFDISITPLQNNGDRFLGVSISFEDVTDCHQLQVELNRSQEELETAYEELQSSNEELETTNEELQSTVEELQTTNEELQSTNEEMETINEELRTANEDLQHKNQKLQERTEELRTRTGELDEANSFLRRILASVDVGIVVIDQDFEVLLWNDETENLWGLEKEKVIGRSLLSLDIGLPVEELAEPIRDFVHRADEQEEQKMSLNAVTQRGKPVTIRFTNTLRVGSDAEKASVVLVMEEIERE